MLWLVLFVQIRKVGRRFKLQYEELLKKQQEVRVSRHYAINWKSSIVFDYNNIDKHEKKK